MIMRRTSYAVGALAAQCAFARGASRVLVLEKEAYRLQQLRTHVPRAEGIDSTQERGIDRLRALTGHGPDCAIEAVRVGCFVCVWCVCFDNRKIPYFTMCVSCRLTVLCESVEVHGRACTTSPCATSSWSYAQRRPLQPSQ